MSALNNVNKGKDFRRTLIRAAKITVVVLSFGYIIREIFFRKDLDPILALLQGTFSVTHRKYSLLVASIFILFNWGIEAVKWRFLIRGIERVSWTRAFRAVLSGVTVSVFTPNRVGEFGGRVFYLDPDNRIPGIIATIVGSMSQLLTTLITGSVAAVFYLHTFPAPFSGNISVIISILIGFNALALFLFFNTGWAVRHLPQGAFSRKVKRFAGFMAEFTGRRLLLLLLLSLLRYAVFSAQFLLLLLALGVDIGIAEGMLMISVTFFVITAIPTFALTEWGVRGATAVYFIGQVTPDTGSVAAASFVLWILNLALPALAGAWFIFGMKVKIRSNAE